MNETIREFLEKLKYPRQDIRVCIETGTHRGWGTEVFPKFFDKVYTIELSQELYEFSKERLKDITNIEFLQGKSHEILKQIIPAFKDNYFLFLDAHGSGGDTVFDPEIGARGSPVIEELKSCIIHPPSVVVIDDYVDFKTLSTYPSLSNITKEMSNLGIYNSYEINKYREWLIFEKVM